MEHIWGVARLGKNGRVLIVLGSIEGAAYSGDGLFRVCRDGVVFDIVDIPDCTSEGIVAVQGKL